jgi:hypothetical protein
VSWPDRADNYYCVLGGYLMPARHSVFLSMSWNREKQPIGHHRGAGTGAQHRPPATGQTLHTHASKRSFYVHTPPGISGPRPFTAPTRPPRRSRARRGPARARAHEQARARARRAALARVRLRERMPRLGDVPARAARAHLEHARGEVRRAELIPAARELQPIRVHERGHVVRRDEQRLLERVARAPVVPQRGAVQPELRRASDPRCPRAHAQHAPAPTPRGCPRARTQPPAARRGTTRSCPRGETRPRSRATALLSMTRCLVLTVLLRIPEYMPEILAYGSEVARTEYDRATVPIFQVTPHCLCRCCIESPRQTKSRMEKTRRGSAKEANGTTHSQTPRHAARFRPAHSRPRRRCHCPRVRAIGSYLAHRR